MVFFIFSLLFIFAVAVGVVAAFALPHLRAGSPVLTPEGEQAARRVQHRLEPVLVVVWPRIRPAVLAGWRRLRPLAQRVWRRAAPALNEFADRSAVGVGLADAVAPGSAERRRAGAPVSSR